VKPSGSMSAYVAEAMRRQPRKRACLNADQLVEFYRGELDESQIELIRDHLAECTDCLELARDARQFLAAMGESVTAELRNGTVSSGWFQTRSGKLLLIAASLVIVAGAGLLVWREWRVKSPAGRQAQGPSATPTPRVPENPWQDLTIAKAEYTRPKTSREELIWRDGNAQTPNRPGPFVRAMAPYEQNDFAAAEKQLAQFLEKNPNHAAANFYRGVSQLLLGKLSEAVTSLEAAVAHGDVGFREEALWYLALAHLKAGSHSRALADLDAVIGVSVKHRVEAEQLRQKVKQFIEQGASSS
jgi:tetratricopeptide (TPR) repeat protein